ncbi:MAG TPA: rhodanese-like domain-containing protein [Candidatus Sulfotelmatobacter sp.]|nr:rhodanese-like domain-containing protein [Candidatus Sulfotelmatobacter sp.]
MYFEQFYLGCLAHASYLLASQGEAVVVDPQRDVELYLTAAAQQGVAIRHIVETHLHADFVSGHKELAQRTGATIYIGARAGATFSHVGVRDGFELKFGAASIRVLETPGHTPESICLVVADKEKSAEPWAVLTGDTLFIGDVGRPDLSPSHTPAELAALLYDSLHKKLMPLADNVLVYPAHGAGSLCGKNMRAERSSTIGTERLTNYALQIKSREEFVKQLTSHLPARPEYFQKDAEINRAGAGALSELPPPRAIKPAELKTMLLEGEIALDVRPGEEFAAGHVPGSVNIALSGQFASWAGTVLGLSAHPVLIAASDAQLEEARLRLARVGIEALDGFLDGGVAAWEQAGFALATIPQIAAGELHARLKAHEVQVLDVRREPEWDSGHIEHATWWPLDNFRVSPPELDRDAVIAVHCKGGYRSMIAASLLQRAGFKNVIDVSGGFDAWQGASLPVVTAKPLRA